MSDITWHSGRWSQSGKKTIVGVTTANQADNILYEDLSTRSDVWWPAKHQSPRVIIRCLNGHPHPTTIILQINNLISCHTAHYIQWFLVFSTTCSVHTGWAHTNDLPQACTTPSQSTKPNHPQVKRWKDILQNYSRFLTGSCQHPVQRVQHTHISLSLSCNITSQATQQPQQQ